ncbi:MAG: cytochrome c5 family protein [Marinobacter sp.]|uniref:c-type cytochrome n=1 Tax=Marinobacter sp. TaxID=50741 RepID=UPI001B720CCA|nr:c-type cytochrome [Marinobacter sp.]MBQ0747643.1 cytochrome c5 family protein [Marinobacter sp.]MBQ0815855.1 cytochrome c5 family protein [Marinobacter sp.]|tara:strand:+ start:1826 stop:2239 length:414 start_codon:yes stop_codon:yes gene_type:complete
MKKVLAVVLLGFGITAGAVMASVEDEIRARIQPVGEVCLQGDECGEAAAASETASSGPRSGSEVYGAVCMACHTTGAAGAPVIGDAGAWAPRVDQGMETLISHAINGFNAMPAKGGCASCPDEEIAAAVEHIVAESK